MCRSPGPVQGSRIMTHKTNIWSGDVGLWKIVVGFDFLITKCWKLNKKKFYWKVLSNTLTSLFTIVHKQHWCGFHEKCFFEFYSTIFDCACSCPSCVCACVRFLWKVMQRHFEKCARTMKAACHSTKFLLKIDLKCISDLFGFWVGAHLFHKPKQTEQTSCHLNPKPLPVKVEKSLSLSLFLFMSLFFCCSLYLFNRVGSVEKVCIVVHVTATASYFDKTFERSLRLLVGHFALMLISSVE